MKVVVEVHPYYAPAKQWLAPRELTKNEQVFVRLALKNSSFEQFVEYPFANVLEFAEKDGVYAMDVILTANSKQIGGYVSDMLEIKYRDIAGALTVVIPVVEYRPTPVNDAQQVSLAGFLQEGEYAQLRPVFK